MNREFKKTIKNIKTILLSEKEKQHLWHNVDAYVRNNPVKETPAIFVSIKEVKHKIFSPYFVHTQRLVVLSLALLVFFGGGTSLLAKGALPKDTLYPFKLQAEQVRSWFLFGAESKAYFETKRAGERLEEAQKLAVKGELDTEAKEIIKKGFEKHAHEVQKQVAVIEANDDLKVAIDVSENFEKSLKEHSKSLTKIEKEQKASVEVIEEKKPVDVKTDIGVSLDTDVAVVGEVIPSEEPAVLKVAVDTNTSEVEKTEVVESELSQIVSSIEENLIVSVQAREEVEAKIPTIDNNETKKDIAQNKRENALVQIDKVKVILEDNNKIIDRALILPVASSTLASTTLDRAITFVADGDVQFNTAEYGGAFTLFKQGFDTAVEAENIISTSTLKSNPKSN